MYLNLYFQTRVFLPGDINTLKKMTISNNSTLLKFKLNISISKNFNFNCSFVDTSSRPIHLNLRVMKMFKLQTQDLCLVHFIVSFVKWNTHQSQIPYISDHILIWLTCIIGTLNCTTYNIQNKTKKIVQFDKNNI